MLFGIMLYRGRTAWNTDLAADSMSSATVVRCSGIDAVASA
jgi:hypothetical protein